jgi:hypothetical protein
MAALRYSPLSFSFMEDALLSLHRRTLVASLCGLFIFSFPAAAQQTPHTKTPKKIQMAQPASEPKVPLTGQTGKQAQPQPIAQLNPALLKSLHWRGIGPYRGGRTRGVAGVPSQPNIFYVGVCNGGVWKTTDYGRTWQPIFDGQPTGSIGAVAVAQSDPNIVYVGSGEGLHRPDLSVGDGIYKSTDAGKSWAHLGLRDGQQIPELAVDPRDANKVFAAVA